MEISTAPVGGQTQSDGAWQLAYRATPMGKGGEQSCSATLTSTNVPLSTAQYNRYNIGNMSL